MLFYEYHIPVQCQCVCIHLYTHACAYVCVHVADEALNDVVKPEEDSRVRSSTALASTQQ